MIGARQLILIRQAEVSFFLQFLKIGFSGWLRNFTAKIGSTTLTLILFPNYVNTSG